MKIESNINYQIKSDIKMQEILYLFQLCCCPTPNSMTVHIKVLKSYISLTTHLNPKFLTIKGRQSKENRTKYFLLQQSEEFTNITHRQTDRQTHTQSDFLGFLSKPKNFYTFGPRPRVIIPSIRSALRPSKQQLKPNDFGIS